MGQAHSWSGPGGAGNRPGGSRKDYVSLQPPRNVMKLCFIGAGLCEE